MPENLIGADALKTLLGELPKRVVNRGLRQAVNAASAPIQRAAKANAPRASGALKRAIGRKVKAYRGTVVSAIGARKDVKKYVSVRGIGGKTFAVLRRPSRYLHLVEKGMSKGAKPNPFLDQAYRANKASAERIAADKLAGFVESEAAKLGRR